MKPFLPYLLHAFPSGRQFTPRGEADSDLNHLPRCLPVPSTSGWSPLGRPGCFARTTHTPAVAEAARLGAAPQPLERSRWPRRLWRMAAECFASRRARQRPLAKTLTHDRIVVGDTPAMDHIMMPDRGRNGRPVKCIEVAHIDDGNGVTAPVETAPEDRPHDDTGAEPEHARPDDIPGWVPDIGRVGWRPPRSVHDGGVIDGHLNDLRGRRLEPNGFR